VKFYPAAKKRLPKNFFTAILVSRKSYPDGKKNQQREQRQSSALFSPRRCDERSERWSDELRVELRALGVLCFTFRRAAREGVREE
jgi:hypothetical protein